MAIVDISVVPVGTETPSVSNFVKEAVKIIKESGLQYQIGAMGTTIEGDLNKIFNLIEKIHRHCFNLGAKRLLTTIRIDERVDKAQTMKEKIEKATV